MKHVGALKSPSNWLVATLVTAAIWTLTMTGTNTSIGGFFDTAGSAVNVSSATTTAFATTEKKETKDNMTFEQLKKEETATTIVPHPFLREQRERLGMNSGTAALEREQQQQNNSEGTARRSLHSGSHRGGGGGYYRRYNGYGGKKGNVGKGKGGTQYYDGITAKGNGNSRKYYNWKPPKGKGAKGYNGYGGKKGNVGKGKGGTHYYDGITAKGNGNSRKYYNWKPPKGKGAKGKGGKRQGAKGKGYYGKGKGTTECVM
jgi:hypothetical protein